MNNLLKKTTIFAVMSASLYGCGGPDSGYEHPFINDNAVVYSNEAISQTFTEESGVQQINLLEGATVNGTALTVDSSTSPIHIREIAFVASNGEFVTPQKPGFAANQTVSPFTFAADGVTLLVDTDAFSESLRMCDTTDVRGDTNPDGTPKGNGSRDFPTTISYTINYIVDNGFELAPGASHPFRTLNLTLNAISDPVTNVQAFDLNVATGDSKPMLSATAPAYSCNSALTYAIADEAIATVDAAGSVTGVARGETTITVTSVENPELSATAVIKVTSGFNLNIVSQDVNELGAPLGTKSVPTCSAIGVGVEPSIVADTLTGEYDYSWVSESADANFLGEQSDGAFGATGQFSNTLAAGEQAKINVGFSSGYTGATAAGDILEQSVTVTAERNYACDPNPNADGAVFYVSDLGLNNGGWGPNAAPVAEGLDGNSLRISSTNNGAMRGITTQQQWNQVFNFHAATYGRGEASVGRKFKFAVWAKLGQLPSDEVKLDHTLLPWNCTGCEGLANFPARYEAGVQGAVSAVLKPTTDWQFVEFINPLTGTNVWEVPANWNQTTVVFQFWDLYGFADGETILLDNYSIVEVE